MNPFLLFDMSFMMLSSIRNERLGSSEVRELQNKRLRALIKHSYENVPYYHALFKEAEIKPDDVNTVDDLGKIPITTKEKIRDLPMKEITAKNIDLNKCIIRSTSGSTGVPLKIPWNLKAYYRMLTVYIRWMMECGNKAISRNMDLEFILFPIDTLIQ